MLNKRILVLMFLLVFLPLALVGCHPTPIPSNEAPILTSDPITTATVGVVYTYDVNAIDPDGDTLAYSLATKPSGMTINFATGLINWIPTAKGDYPVVVRISDGDLDITQSFTIKVSAVEPELTGIVVVPKTMNLFVGEEEGIVSVTAYYSDGSKTILDLDDCDYKSSNEAVATVWFLGLVSAKAKGTVTITVGYKGKFDTVVVTVSKPTPPPVNHPPIITSTPGDTAIVGAEYIYEVKAYDPDGDVLTYSLITKPAGMTIDSNIVSWTPTEGQIGVGNFTVKVSDGQLSDTQSFGIIVSGELPPVNQSPVASFTANPTSGIVPLKVYFDAFGSSYDLDGSIISYDWDFGDGSNDSGSTTSHIYENPGDYIVQLTVTDDDSASDSITMVIEAIEFESGTIVDGIISSNTTWTIANSPYIINNEDLQIAQNVTLLIEEGVIVKANPWRMIRVAGNLNTNGSESSPVKFTSLGSSKWWGIEFINSLDSSINNTIIENAECAINLKGLSPVNFVGNVFRYNEWAVTDDHGYQNMHFLNNTFLNNEEVFCGIRTSGDENRFENNIFIDNNRVFGFGYYFGQTVITNNNFLNNNFIIRAPVIGYGYGTIDISNNWWGTTDTNIIDDCIIDGKDDVELQIINYEPIKNSEISDIGSPISVE